MPRPTRKVMIEVDIPVSRCEICGSEEVAKAGGFGLFMPDGRPTHSDEAGARYQASGWSFASHGEVRVSDQRSNVFPQPEKGDWTLCAAHVALVKRRIGEIVAEERARVS